MNSHHHRSNNCMLTAPNCDDLPATRLINDATGETTFTTFWKPTEKELAALNRGEYVMLWVWGSGQPPVKLETSGEGVYD